MALTVPSSQPREHRRETAQLCFDAIEFADPLHAILGNGSRAGAGDLDQLTPSMRPTVGKLDIWANTIRRNQPIISGVTIHLKDAREPLQYPFGMLPAATWGIGKGDAWRRTSAPRSIIAGQRPEVSSFGFCANRDRGLAHASRP
jgi:hypothetical protein